MNELREYSFEEAVRKATENGQRKIFIQSRGDIKKPKGFPPESFLRRLGIEQLRLVENAVYKSKTQWSREKDEFFQKFDSVAPLEYEMIVKWALEAPLHVQYFAKLKEGRDSPTLFDEMRIRKEAAGKPPIIRVSSGTFLTQLTRTTRPTIELEDAAEESYRRKQKNHDDPTDEAGSLTKDS